MNFWVLSALFNFVAAMICAVIIFVQNPKSRKNRTYTLFCLDLGLWAFFYFFWQISRDAASALFFIRITMVFACFIPAFHFHHILALFDLMTPWRKRFLMLTYAISVTCALGRLTPYFLERVEPRFGFPFWPVPGFFIHLYFLTVCTFMAYSFTLVWGYRKREPSPVYRNQLSWLLLSHFIGYAGGMTTIPLWYNIPIPPIGFAGLGIYMIVSSLIFFRLGLLDIHLFVRDTLSHLSTTLGLGGGLALLTLLLTRSPAAGIAVIFCAILIPILYQPLYRRVHRWFQRILMGQDAPPLQVLTHSIEQIRETTYSYDALAQNIVTSLLTSFPIEMVAVYFYDLNRKAFHLRAQTGMKSPLAADLHFNKSQLAVAETDPLIAMIGSKKDILLKDAIATGPLGTKEDRGASATLTRIEADLCAPLLFGGTVKGLIIISRKKHQQMFNSDDIEAINAFARMSEEVMRTIIGMETELKNISLYSHDLDNDSRSIMQTLEFIQSPMAHNIPHEKLASLLSQAQDVAQRLNQTMKLNRDRSNLIMRTIRGDYEKGVVDIWPLVRMSVGKFALQADKQKVQLTSQIPDGPLNLNGNASDLIRVVDNLISNGLRYVAPETGHIHVAGQESPAHVQISIHDNGAGIPADDIAHIWELGYQSKAGNKGAAGFGLAIVRQIIDLHHGSIAVASDGPGRGTTFTLTLPRP